MIEGVAGVIIWTHQLDRLAEFYRNTLELVPHSVRPDFISFRWDNVRLSIGKHSGVFGSSRDPMRIMVNLLVSDIQVEYERLVSRGVMFIREPELEHWGGWVSTLRDPDGNVIQLLEYDDLVGVTGNTR